MANRAAALLLAVLLSFCAYAQRHKPVIDPESKEGYLLQQIQQERDAARKLQMLNDFAADFPKSESLPWVYEQLLSAHWKTEDYEKVLRDGAKLAELDPDDLSALNSCVRAADALKDPDAVKRYAVAAWKTAARIGPASSKDSEFAQQIMSYAEYTLGAWGSREKDLVRRQTWVALIEELNPKSQYLPGKASNFAILVQQGAPPEQLAAAAERELPKDPDNEDLLIVVAQHHLRMNDAPDTVLRCSRRALEVLRSKPAPNGISAEDWEKRKARYSGLAQYMAGMASSRKEDFAAADQYLRAALPFVRGVEDMYAATLYHLGYANFRLAEAGDRPRVFEALKFNEQCAAIRSAWQEQAQRNIQSIRSEYNLK